MYYTQKSAPSRALFYKKLKYTGAEDRNRTGTEITLRGILSPLRLPVPPPRHEVEATPRIELGIKVLQTSALPLGYVATKWSGKRDSNSRPPPWQGGALPLSYFRITMVPQDRIELSTHGFSVRCSTD